VDAHTRHVNAGKWMFDSRAAAEREPSNAGKTIVQCPICFKYFGQ